MALPVVGLSVRGSPIVVRTRDSRGTRAFDGSLLDRRRHGFLHVFHDAGVLLDADLPGAGIADRVCARSGWAMDQDWVTNSAGNHDSVVRRIGGDSSAGVEYKSGG